MIGYFIKIKPSTALKVIKVLPFKRSTGVCSQFFNVYGKNVLSCLGVEFKDYPKFSGDRNYPVPHPTVSPSKAFRIYNHWDKTTEYGRNRYDFLDWLIKEFEKKGM